MTDLEDLNGRPVPDWYEDAKLGIFIHWGMWAVPAFAPKSGHLPDLMRTHYHDLNKYTPYTEWYWNAIKLEGSPAAEFHKATYGDMPYEAFREMFESEAGSFDAQVWADLFAEAGARYVVFVTKHHDGYCLWPTAHENPHKPGWSSKRDYVGELAAAVRAKGLRFGVYYSGGLDWTFNPQPIANFGDMMASQVMDESYAAYADHQFRELIERYRPDVLWNDIGHPRESDIYPLFHDYYEAVPEGVVNDRWIPPGDLHRSLLDPKARAGFNAAVAEAAAKAPAKIIPPLPPHCDFRTPEFSAFEDIEPKKWEATRGLGAGFGFNRSETDDDLLGEADLICSFIDMVSKNGNFLLNVGPEASGLIPEIQSKRLRALGGWLQANGAAVYGTRPWRRAAGETQDGLPVRLTASADRVYAILLGRPEGPVQLVDPPPGHPALIGMDPALPGSGLVETQTGGFMPASGTWPDAPAIVLAYRA